MATYSVVAEGPVLWEQKCSHRDCGNTAAALMRIDLTVEGYPKGVYPFTVAVCPGHGEYVWAGRLTTYRNALVEGVSFY